MQHSKALVATIQQAIEDAGGALPFRDYMRLALYAPGLGYYQSGTAKLGIGGDFVTAPEISPAFGQVLAGQISHSLRETGGNTILEVGAGSGRLAVEILQRLSQLGFERVSYCILDVSGDLRQRQEKMILSHNVANHQVRWLDRLPEAPFRGVIVANEVADALPVERFCWRHGTTSRLAVHIEGKHKLEWVEIPADEHLEESVNSLAAKYQWNHTYTSELSPELPGWINSLAACINQGEILLIDYGLREQEYYHPSRADGTLRCHYRQIAHCDPFLWPGLSDISTWVDFTAAAQAAEQSGMLATLSTQGNFLVEGDIGSYIQCAQSDVDRYRRSGEVQKLVMPSEMGESFKVLSLTRGCTPSPAVIRRPLRWEPILPTD